MNRALFFRAAALGLLVSLAPSADRQKADAKPPKESRWEPAIARFEAQDRKSPPAKGGVLFVGSSSIRGWDLAKSFPKHRPLNRGFGGSQVADSVQFAERIILKHAPRVVVVYAGDNDIAAGKSPETVLADYRALVKKIHASLPKTRIVYIAIKPSLSRWKLVDKMRAANALIGAEAKKDPRLRFVDIDKPMIGSDGKPRKELFRPDGLHLNYAGYKLWTSLVLAELAAE
jgi:lysophospholipase L1-like esterase